MNLIPFKLGFFLARRQIANASLVTTVLIIFVMTLTFLNLVVVTGVLVGLLKSNASNTFYTGDVIVSSLDEKSYIENSQQMISIIENQPGVKALSARYVQGGKLEANYKDVTRITDKINDASGQIYGINIEEENKVTNVSSKIIEGSFLNANDYDQIVVGANILYKYSPVDSPNQKSLRNVAAGDKVRLTVNGNSREVTIKGVIKSKVNQLDVAIFMNDWQLKSLIGRQDNNVSEIAIRLNNGVDVQKFKQNLISYGLGRTAKISDSEEAKPKFLRDVEATFGLMGNLIGSIGLAVASITIFIVIFVNAVTRRKFIGILKGIGISSRTIEISYIFQALFYAICGTTIGMIVIYGFLVPYIDVHRINFPFSDGILYAPLSGTLLRVFILIVITLIAGYLPARIIVKQNTLDAILGR